MRFDSVAECAAHMIFNSFGASVVEYFAISKRNLLQITFPSDQIKYDTELNA